MIINLRKVFIDTNVFDEYFSDGPAADEIAAILEFIKLGQIVGCTSPKTLMDISYPFHSEKGIKAANRRQVYALIENYSSRRFRSERRFCYEMDRF